jgi:hypothetical protein
MCLLGLHYVASRDAARVSASHPPGNDQRRGKLMLANLDPQNNFPIALSGAEPLLLARCDCR